VTDAEVKGMMEERLSYMVSNRIFGQSKVLQEEEEFRLFDILKENSQMEMQKK
jgi:peptidyl-prolyl cis-trans isomerase SurA